MTMAVDTSALERAIPQIVAFGRRTMQQQCVTSAYFICRNAMNETEKIFPDSIDARLGIKVTSYTNANKNRVSKAKNRTRFKSSSAVGKAVPLGVLVIMARMRPGSNYNALTGNKWALDSSLLKTGPGTAMQRQGMIDALLTKMISARRSSSAYLKSGWKTPLRLLYASPFMVKKSAAFRQSVANESATDQGNARNTERLGDATINAAGDAIMVTAINYTPLGGNSALEERHQHYAELQALPPLIAAVEKEAAGIMALVEERLNAGMKQNFIDI